MQQTPRALFPPRLARGVVPLEECAAMTRAVYAARAEWTSAFDGEQFSLGRAFYTHYEQDQSDAYFEAAAASDACVERYLPGLQARMRDLVAAHVGGIVIARRDWCGAGVHIFPAGEGVAREGGVLHFDTEGLTEHHLTRQKRAVTAVLMLQPAERGGTLRVWDVAYAGQAAPTEAELRAPSVTFEYAAGDLVVIDSYALHQIQPFEGVRDRISVTLHAAAINVDRWETWF